jgi:probable HAF family extracellular repeat protein
MPASGNDLAADGLRGATGINDNGQIIANTTDTATGQTLALLLTPS